MYKFFKKLRIIFLRPASPIIVLGLFILVCAIVGTGIVANLFHRPKSNPVPVSSLSAAPSPQVSRGNAQPGEEADPRTHPQQYDLELVEKTLSVKQKIHFPAVDVRKAIAISELPRDVFGLLLEPSEGVQAERVVYTNKKSGYILTYRLLSTKNYDQLSGIFRDKLGRESTGEWNEIYGFVELTSKSANSRVVWRRVEIGVYTIEVQTILL